MKISFLDVVAVGGAMGGSLMIALNRPDLALWGYIFFLASSLSSAYLLMKSDAPKSLLITNIYFSIVNMLGIFMRM